MQRGQQVEVLEPSSMASMVLVRLFGQKEEGLIPLSSLKQPNGGFKYRNVKDDQGKPKLTIYYTTSIVMRGDNITVV